MQSIPPLALAVLIPLAALALQWALWDYIQPYVWILFYPAVFLAALSAGFGGGVVATLISALLIWYLFLPPRFSFALESPGQLVPIFVFVASGLLFSLFSERVRRANRVLARQEGDAVLHQVLDNAADAVFIASPQGRLAYVNRRACALLDHGAEDLLRLEIGDLVAAESIAEVAATLARLRSGYPMRAEIHLRRADGSVVPVDVSTSLLPDGKLFWSCRDNSELVAAREARERSEQRYRAVFHAHLEAISIVRVSDGIWLDANQVLLDATGYERHEVIGRTSLELQIWADPADMWQMFNVLQRDGQCHSRDYRFRKKSGELVWGLIEATLIDLDDVPCILTITRDISELKAAQEELHRHRTELQRMVWERTADLQKTTGALLDTQFAMERVGIVIHWINADTGRFLHVNRAAATALGYTVDEMLALSVPDIDPDCCPVNFREATAHLRRQKCTRFETTHRSKHGRLVPVEVAQYFLPAKPPVAPRFIAFIEDITRRKEAEAAQSQIVAAAASANAAKSAFLANMSHEIRTPLHVIAGLGHLLRRDLTDPLQRQRLDQLCASSEHLLAIINDILDLSKIEAQRLVLDHGDFRLGTMIDKVMGMVEGLAREKKLTLSVDIAPALREMSLRGDPLRLAQVLLNLCGNAVKFTDRGAVRLAVICTAGDATGIALRFAVEDSGIGIGAAEQARLFQPFAQADSSSTRQHRGTGLGLAISQRLVAMMGGTIQLESQPGVGSRFSFALTLPRAVSCVAEPAPAPAVAPAGDLCGRHVLLVEDHPLSQEILLEMLEDLGCVGDVAANGAEAVACAEQRGYDVILMDMQMPKMDGLAATRAIRALARHRATPIVALTANAYAEDRQHCLDAGMNGHLGKPVTPAALAAALGQWLPELDLPGDETAPCDNALSRALAAIPGLEVARAMRGSPPQLEDYCALLNRFLQLHGQDMARLRAHLAAGEHEAARLLMHKLQGIAGLIGARRVVTLARDIEQALRAAPDASVIGELAAACESELARLAQAFCGLPLAAEAAAG